MAISKIILVVNGGSTSIKCAAYLHGNTPNSLQTLLKVQIDHIGEGRASLQYSGDGLDQKCERINVPTFQMAIRNLLDWFNDRLLPGDLDAIGHRVIHGLDHQHTAFVNNDLLNEFRRLYPYDPEHQPIETQLLKAFGRRYPAVPQVACFDTAFHANLPRVAQVLPIPRRFNDEGVHRWGFHGLSCTYVLGELARVAGAVIARGRIIIAHLGGGSSMTAIRDGESIDTSMGFSPAGGLPMGNRTGDLDPGVAWYMIHHDHLDAAGFNHLVNHESGLKGISGISGDMKTLLELESTHPAAAEAIAYYCYQVKKYIGAYIAALGGLDALVFTGGIGEQAAPIRSRICTGLAHLGILLDEGRNEASAPFLSDKRGKVGIYVIPTDEELVIARSTLLHLGVFD